MGTYDETKVGDMVGCVFESVVSEKGAAPEVGDGEIRFYGFDGTRNFRMCHYQNCCEDVSIKDIVGDVNDLVGVPLLEAYEDGRSATTEECYDSGTWTFYRFITIKGTVVISWLGESNGCYSEEVNLVEI